MNVVNNNKYIFSHRILDNQSVSIFHDNDIFPTSPT